MEAIIKDSITYKVISVKGDYVYAEYKGKVKCFLSSEVNIIEAEEVVSKSNKNNSAKKLSEKLYVTSKREQPLTREEIYRIQEWEERRKWETISW